MKRLQKHKKRLQKIIKSFLTDQEKIPDKANFVENEKIISDSPMGLQNNSILFITRNQQTNDQNTFYPSILLIQQKGNYLVVNKR